MSDPASEGESPRRRPSADGRPAVLLVLVVEDNRDAAEAIAETVRFLGHEAVVAHDGLAALELAEERLPEVVLLDIGLPTLDGYEVARRLRKGKAARATLVALTGYGDESDRVESIEAGLDHHLIKPISMARIETLLQEVAARPAAAGSAKPIRSSDPSDSADSR